MTDESFVEWLQNGYKTIFKNEENVFVFRVVLEMLTGIFLVGLIGVSLWFTVLVPIGVILILHGFYVIGHPSKYLKMEKEQ